jgi:hypothetical protein
LNELQHCKFVSAVKPGALIDNNTATADVVDCRGFDYATIVVQLGATDIAMTALKVQSSSTSGGTYADITGATFAGGSGLGGATLALPSATDDGQTCVFQIELRGLDPFLKLVATFGDGTSGGYIAAVAILSRAKFPPITSAATADGDVCLVV